MGALGQFVQLQVHQVWHEEKQAPATSDQGALAQVELAQIGNRFNGGPGEAGPFLIQPPGQWSKAFGFEHLAHGRGAQGTFSLVEGMADVVDGVILLAQLDDELASGRLLGLSLGAAPGTNKEHGIGLPAEVIAENMEGAWRIAELMSDFFGWLALQEIGAEGLVLALSGMAGLSEEASNSA